MLTEKRHQLILDELNKAGMVSVIELSELLNASESTIRRDLNLLSKEGKLVKVHGGATLVEDYSNQEESSTNKRYEMNTVSKMEIAKKAADLIQDGDIIYIDAGTTTTYLIDFITAKELIVVTNGIVHAKKLLEKNIKTFILGGEIKMITEAIVGLKAAEDLKKYNFTKAFLGTNGISNSRGYTTPDINEALVKETAIKHCKEAFVLADSSKFESINFVTFCEIEDATLITDRLTVKSIGEKTNIIEVGQHD